ncbi:MAG TPA: Tat pathway signal sequence domain protein [Opitutaceae bacterium]|nr:Tat pathway signal sequence domain protein [Opitutaceae bacterium]
MKTRPSASWAALLAACSLCLPASRLTAAAAPVQLHWLDQTPPALAQGVSWGVPWPQGAVAKNATFNLTDAQGKSLPVQTWPLAYWPDGSLKWSGLATVVPAGQTGELTLAAGAPAAGASAVSVSNDGRSVVVDTGALKCSIPLSGQNLIDSISIGGAEVARAGQLVGILQDGPVTNPEDAPKREKMLSSVKKVTVEQSGPVRAVVKIEGMHKGLQSGREWLPFTVRLYFYGGQTAVRLVHTIVFDGDQEKDFLRGLGVQFAVPLHEQVQNRDVRFAGANGGIWSEPLQPGGGNVAQENGEPFEGRNGFNQNAVWDDFKLSQPTPDGFTIVKRTNPKSTWLFSAAGQRSEGLAYVGDLKSGLAVSVKNFWQSYPAELEVDHASTPAAELIAWLWSPDGPQMDMRHYDVVAHGLGPSYEDVQPGLSTAYGVARTSELTLYPSGPIPTRPALAAMAKAGTELPMIAATPAYIHSTGVFGVWSLEDRSTPFKKAVEDSLDAVLAYYQHQVDDQDWYGFWQYGDFMHSYSAPRHKWHYDWGGHAWDNTELGAPLWMWYSYLRSGRADLFRLAEAHTRNTSETNVYHLGDMAGLGSRHNVIKWGDGAKEARVSQAAHWRPFYYLTTDERTGDIMREMLKSDAAAIKYDPMREAEPPVPGEPVFPARIRIGPDWFALAGNWMTEWERTGDTKWRDRILAGVDSIVAMPFWLETGQLNGLNPDIPGGGIGKLKGGGAQLVGYDLATGKLSVIRDPVTKGSVPVSYNLATIQGGGEVMFELVPLLGRKDFATAWLQYCRIGAAPAEVLTADKATGTEGADARYVLNEQSGPRLAAYAYAQTRIPAFAQRAITSMLSRDGTANNPQPLSPPEVLKPTMEAAGVSTNDAAQSGLTTIEILELCKDQLPVDAPPRVGRVPGAGRGQRGGPRGDAPPAAAAGQKQ